MDIDKFTVAADTGDTAIAGELSVTGAASFYGGLAMDTDKFTVADGSGNTATAGTLSVGSTVTVTGATALSGGLAFWM